MKSVRIIILPALLLLVSGSFVRADVPHVMNYQGVLRDSADQPLDGPHDMVFRFFSPADEEILIDRHTAAQGGAVTVAGGMFDVWIGAGARVVVTANEGRRGGRTIPLKANVDAAANIDGVTTLEKVLVVRNTGGDIDWHDERDVWLHEAAAHVDADCPAEPMNAEAPLYILYTSGSTGKPKGVVLSNRNIIEASKSSSELDKLTENESILAYLPMAWLGDFNNDRLADLVLGLPAAEGGDGRVSVVYGRAGDWPAICRCALREC